MMTPDETFHEIVAKAKRQTLSGRYGPAAKLFAQAAETPQAQADAETRRYCLLKAAVCTYLDRDSPSEARTPKALKLTREVLKDKDAQPEVAARIVLAKALKGELAFGQARRLLSEARALIQADAHPAVQQFEEEARQQHALCTYKDVDLPPSDRLDDALKILDGTDALRVEGLTRLATTKDQETLGIAGAIHKAKWKFDAQREHLGRSLHYYERGTNVGVANDFGYTSINAAFVLDLLASIEEGDLQPDSKSIAARRARAWQIRIKIFNILPEIADAKTRAQWWYTATLAEAAFGLHEFKLAGDVLENARKVTVVDDWEFESTVRQLAALLNVLPGDETAKQLARDAFSRGVGVDAATARALLAGKFGLALSGGGFRASLFHIGVLARLAELDVLRHVEVLSCVSGGSIIGAYYYLEVRKLFRDRAPACGCDPSHPPGEKVPPRPITRDDYIAIVERITEHFLKGVQTNVRIRMVGSLVGNLRMVWKGLSRTERIGELFEEKIFSRVGTGPHVLNDLAITPQGWVDEERGPFKPKHHNWRLSAKVPILILNATTLNTGHNWQFTTSFMGESPLSIDPEIDGNYRLRRLYYQDAPTKELREFGLGRAVVASACVPVLFEPIALAGLYDDKIVRLVDGGVHDNQGIVGLMEQDCTVMLVSDASGHVGVEDDPKPSELGVAMRSNNLSMARIRGAQYRDLKSRLRSRVIRGLMFLHLRKDLDVDPINWVKCNDPTTPPLGEMVTSYGIPKAVQEKLAAIRTDLDSFGDAEAFALMTSGYRMTDKVFPECAGTLVETHAGRRWWRFLGIHDLLTGESEIATAAHADLMLVLDVGRHQFFKVFFLYPRLMRAATVAGYLAVASALAGLAYGWWCYSSYPLLTVGAVAGWAIMTIAGLMGLGWLTKHLLRQQFSRFVRNVGLAIAGCLVASVHLAVFDPWYLKRGRDYRK